MSAVRRVFGNAAALYVLQIVNYLFPLVIVPFLLRTIGVGRFGAIAYTGAVIQFGLILTEYGFGYTASQRAATLKDDPAALGRLFAVVLRRKAILGALAVVGLGIATALLPQLRAEWPLLVAQVPMLLGEILFPLWLFLGMQRMAAVTIINVISRSATMAILLLLVRDPGDAVLAAAIQAGHFTLAGVIACVVLFRRMGVPFVSPLTVTQDHELMTDAKRVFVGSVAGQIYLRGPMVVLGFFVGEIELGRFAIGQKVAGLLAMVASPFLQSVYPHICALWERTRERVRRWYLTMVPSAALVLFVTIAVMNALAAPLVVLLAGEHDDTIVSYLRWFSPVIFAATMNVVLNTFVMATRHFDQMRRMSILGAALFLGSSVPLTAVFGVTGTIVTLAIVEASVLIWSGIFTWFAVLEPAPGASVASVGDGTERPDALG